LKVLLAGESWMTHSVHVKGFDSFTTSSYHEGAGPMIQALRDVGHELAYLPNHLVPDQFPETPEALEAYDALILSDVGANTLLLPDKTFVRSERGSNRLHMIGEYVNAGGSLLMVGGYLTFQGIEAKGAYYGTAVEATLPVSLLPHDDRVEAPQGVVPDIVAPAHPVLEGLGNWPHFLGYNRTTLKPDASLLATINGDPFIAVAQVGRGRSAIFTSDCGPHWGPPEFVAWPHYGRMWSNLTAWLTEREEA
jgi:uncharacterized membrane protein